jgi:hypothetical protein
MNRRVLSLFAATFLALAACGMSGAGTGSPGRGNVITSEQMIGVNAQNAYDAVQKLRPAWLTTRGPTSISNSEPDVASVFLGGNQIGTVEALRNLRPDDIQELRYYEASEAGARFGMGHSRGVIDVIMK